MYIFSIFYSIFENQHRRKKFPVFLLFLLFPLFVHKNVILLSFLLLMFKDIHIQDTVITCNVKKTDKHWQHQRVNNIYFLIWAIRCVLKIYGGTCSQKVVVLRFKPITNDVTGFLFFLSCFNKTHALAL